MSSQSVENQEQAVARGPKAFQDAVVRVMVQIATETLASMKEQYSGGKNVRVLDEVQSELLASITPQGELAPKDELLAELENAFAEDE